MRFLQGQVRCCLSMSFLREFKTGAARSIRSRLFPKTPMQQKYYSTVISDKLVVSIVEVSSAGLQRVFRVRFGSKEVGDITLDSWRSPSVSLCRDGAFVWAGLSAFKFRSDASVERFTVDEEISAIYPLRDNIILVCELSVRLLDDDFRELNRVCSPDVLGSSWWEGEVLHVPMWESQQIDLTVDNGQLKQK